MKQKTPVQELLDYTADLLHTFDSEERVAMAVLDYLKNNKEAMLEKEKDMVCQFAHKTRRVDVDLTGNMGFAFNIEQHYNETFNGEER